MHTGLHCTWALSSRKLRWKAWAVALNIYSGTDELNQLLVTIQTTESLRTSHGQHCTIEGWLQTSVNIAIVGCGCLMCRIPAALNWSATSAVVAALAVMAAMAPMAALVPILSIKHTPAMLGWPSVQLFVFSCLNADMSGRITQTYCTFVSFVSLDQCV